MKYVKNKIETEIYKTNNMKYSKRKTEKEEMI